MRGGRLVRESGFVQHGIHESSRGITREWPAGAVGAMGTGREAEDQDSRIRVSEARDRLPPVFVVAIGATLFACDLFAIRNKARAASTGDNLAVELGEPVGGHVRHCSGGELPGHAGARSRSGGPLLMR